MEPNRLSEIVIKTISETDTVGSFDIEGLYAGYGLTVGNALRRVLLSSLPGAAITQAKIKGVGHEFTTLNGVIEDMVEIGLNLKRIRFRSHSNEPQVLILKAKGEGEVTAAQISPTSEIEVITPDVHIATLTAKDAEFEMEITVERGLGYVPVEDRKMEKLPIGVIALDSFFSPVVKVNFVVENMRVGDRTDYNRVKFTIETDGSITSSEALSRSAELLKEHFTEIGSGITVKATIIAPQEEKAPKKKARAAKASKKGKEK